MTHSTAYDTPAAPKGAAFTHEELRLFESVPPYVRRAALKLATLAWLDTGDEDSVGSALLVIGEKPAEYYGYRAALVDCVDLLRRGPKRA